MGSDNIDNKKLLSEIDSLEDEREATSTAENKKNKGNKWLLILVIIAMIGLSALYFGDYYYYDFFEDTDEDEYSNEEIKNYIEKEIIAKNKFEEQKKNIVIKDSFLNYNRELIAVVSNNNNEVITDLRVEVIFYDGENKPIEIDSSDISIIEKNTEFYIKFWNTPENFERYDFLVSKEYYWYDNEESVTEQISYEIVENRDSKNLVVKSSCSKEISEADFQITYYDENDNIMDIEDICIYDLKKNRTQTEEIYPNIWDNETDSAVEYKRYEVKLLGAYIY